MVHALREAHRVVAPGGVVVEMRPSAIHRRVFVERGKTRRLVGVMRENFHRERQADRAVARVVRDGLFQEKTVRDFSCTRIMDTLEDYNTWLGEFYAVTNSPPHDWLIERLERALDAAPDGSRIIITAPVTVRLLKKNYFPSSRSRRT